MVDIKEQWQRLAIELGFQLKHEIRPQVELPSLHKLAAKAIKKGNMKDAEKFLETPMIKELLAKIFIGSATGIYRDFEFALFRSSISAPPSEPAYYVNIVLMLKNNLQLGLDIQYAGLASKFGKKLMPGKYIRNSGNSDIDNFVAIQAKDRNRARNLLSVNGLSHRLSHLFRFSKRFIISDSSIRYDERGQFIEKENALKIMDMMVEVAGNMEKNLNTKH